MKIYFLLMLCVLFWSGNFVLGRFVHNDIEPMELAFLRWFGVCIVLSPIFILQFKKIMRVIKNNFILMFTYGLLGITVFNTILYIGLQDTTAINALLINSSIPILIVFMSAIILKLQVSNRQIVGIILSTLGVIFLVLKGDLARITTLQFNVGDFWVILTGLIWAFYSVILKFKPKELKDMEFVTAIVYIGTAILLAIYILLGYSVESTVTAFSDNYTIILYVVFFPSIASYIFWHKGIMEIGADKTGQFTHLMPLFGSFLAYIFLDEKLQMYHLLGMTFIALGIYLSLFMKPKAAKTS